MLWTLETSILSSAGRKVAWYEDLEDTQIGAETLVLAYDYTTKWGLNVQQHQRYMTCLGTAALLVVPFLQQLVTKSSLDFGLAPQQPASSLLLITSD